MNASLCRYCGEPYPSDARFCVACGYALLEPAAVGPTVKLAGMPCTVCGAVNPANAQFCADCGRGLRPGMPFPHVRSPLVVRSAPAAAPRNGAPFLWLLIPFMLIMILPLWGRHGGVPFFFFFLPFGLIGGMRRRGYRPHAMGVLWLIGLVALWVTGFWPLLLVLLVLTVALSR